VQLGSRFPITVGNRAVQLLDAAHAASIPADRFAVKTSRLLWVNPAEPLLPDNWPPSARQSAEDGLLAPDATAGNGRSRRPPCGAVY